MGEADVLGVDEVGFGVVELQAATMPLSAIAPKVIGRKLMMWRKRIFLTSIGIGGIDLSPIMVLHLDEIIMKSIDQQFQIQNFR
jgi:hypothetical protein